MTEAGEWDDTSEKLSKAKTFAEWMLGVLKASDWYSDVYQPFARTPIGVPPDLPALLGRHFGNTDPRLQ